MTTTTAAPVRPARLTFAGLLRSEAIKLTSLRSTRTAGVLVVLLVVAGTALRAFAYAQIADPVAIGVPAEQAWRNVLDLGVQAGLLAATVLAVLAVGSEYVQRTALTTFVAAPRRLAVLGAKAIAVVAGVAGLMALGLALGTAVSVPLMDAATLGGPSLDALGAATAGVLTTAIIAAFAVAVAALVRSTAAGITIVLAVLLVLPVVVSLSQLVIGVDLGPFLLSYAAPVTTSAIHDQEALGELGRALPVTLAWLLVSGAAASLALTRRDV